MEQVSMNDGLDGRETVAFGLAAGEVGVFVLALMTAYAALRSGLPGAIDWCLAAVPTAAGAMLAWGRLGGRPLLEWAVLLARFTVRTRHVRVARLRQRWQRMRPVPRALESGAVAIPLKLRRHDAAVSRSGADPTEPPRLSVVAAGRPARAAAVAGAPARPVRSHVIAFFSLNGGTGRTTLAVEVATLLAVRGRSAAATGGRGRRVALLDLTQRSPAVALRLGIPLPADAPAAELVSLVAHDSGLLVFIGPPPDRARGAAAEWVGMALEAAERAGAGVVVVDIDCDLGERCLEVLQRCETVHVTLTPNAGGVLDAYRSTAVLRRLGLRDRIGYVVNRWRAGIDITEAMADLGGCLDAEIPEQEAFVRAENTHRPAALDGAGPAAAAIGRLAAALEGAAEDGGAIPTRAGLRRAWHG